MDRECAGDLSRIAPGNIAVRAGFGPNSRPIGVLSTSTALPGHGRFRVPRFLSLATAFAILVQCGALIGDARAASSNGHETDRQTQQANCSPNNGDASEPCSTGSGTDDVSQSNTTQHVILSGVTATGQRNTDPLNLFAYSFQLDPFQPYANPLPQLSYASETADPGKDGSKTQKPCGKAGDPVNIASGHEEFTENDFTTQHLDPARLTRYYNPTFGQFGLFGLTWSSDFGQMLGFAVSGTISGGYPYSTTCFPVPGSDAQSCEAGIGSMTINDIVTLRADGSQLSYKWNATDQRWEASTPDNLNWITQNADGTWTEHYPDGGREDFTAGGQILDIIDGTGIGWALSYTNKYLTSATSTGGLTVQFSWTGTSVTRITDPAGQQYHYAYDGNGMLSKVTYPNGDIVQYVYGNGAIGGAGNPQWRLLTKVTVNGVVYATNTYDIGAEGLAHSSGLMDGSVDGASFYYGTNSSGNPYTQVTNAKGAVGTYTYQTINNQTKLIEVDQSGVTGCPNTTATTSYDANGHASYSYDQRGIKSTYVYSTNGLLQDEVDGIDPNNPGQSRETVYTWDTTKDRITDIKHYGASRSVPISDTAYVFYPDTSAAKNRLETVTVTNLTPNGTTNQTQTTNYSYTFYSSGMPSSIVISGPMAGASSYAVYRYDTYGNLTSTADAAGNTWTYSGYNGLGLPASVTDPNGYQVSYTYDARGRTISTSRTLDGVAATTSFVYDGLGDLARVTYPDGGVLLYTYDGAGRLTTIATNLGTGSSTHTRGCDTIGTAFEVYENLSYDQLRQLTGDSVLEYDTVSTSGCDGSSSNTTETTWSSHIWERDELGRLTNDRGNHNQNIVYTYDPDGNVATKTDSLGKVWTYGYNAFNQLQTVTDPLNHVTRYAYDAMGNLTEVTDPKGGVTDYTYDGFGQLVAQSSPDSGITTAIYDSLGRRTSVTRADGTRTSFVYDTLNRPTSATAGSLTISYSYDTCTNGKTRLCKITDVSGSISYTYRQNGQISGQTNVINGTSYTTAYAYDNRERLASITYPGGNKVSYSYDALSHATQATATISGTSHTLVASTSYMAHGSGPIASMSLDDGSLTSWTYDTDFRVTAVTVGSLQNLSYAYDANNNLTTLTDNQTAANTQTLAYDALYRLTGVTSSGLGNQSIGFDANGNRTTATWGGYTDTYSPAAYSNQENSITGTRARTFAYDANGNTKSITGYGGNKTLTYDAFNRLATLATSAGTTTYTYNGLNQRVRKAGPGGNFSYVYATDGTLLGETASGGTTLTTEYLYFDGAPVGLIRNGTLYFVHNDHLGRPALVTTAASAIVWQAKNAAFDRTVTTNTIGNLNLGFPGQYYDAESGFYYNMARYYDPTTGRYIQSDQIGLQGGLNPYSYAGNRPTIFVDPYGLYCLSPGQIGAIAGAVGGAVAGGLTGGALGSAGGPAGSLGGFFAGALIGIGPGAAAGYVTGNSLSAAAVSGAFGTGGPAGLPSGIAGGLAQYGAGQLGAGAIAAQGIGGAVQGSLDGAIAAGTIGAAGGGAAGAIGGLVAGLVASALLANNDCGCGH